MAYFEKQTGTLSAFAFKELIFKNSTSLPTVNYWVLMTLNGTA